MNNNERKNDFQSFHDQWCEDWVEDWHEVWYDEDSFNTKQTPQDRYKKAQPNVNEFKRDTELEDVSNYHSNDEAYVYKAEPISDKDTQDKSKSNFLDFAYELESALNTQTHVSKSSKVPDNGVNPSLDVVISMD